MKEEEICAIFINLCSYNFEAVKKKIHILNCILHIPFSVHNPWVCVLIGVIISMHWLFQGHAENTTVTASSMLLCR
jgi:hypothetical protein